MPTDTRLMGYPSSISAAAGDLIDFRVHADLGDVTVRGVRVHGVDTTRDKARLEPLPPWSKTTFAGVQQSLVPGSYAVVRPALPDHLTAVEITSWVQPTITDGRRQVVLSMTGRAGRVALVLADGAVHLETGNDRNVRTASAELPLTGTPWVHLTATVDFAHGEAIVTARIKRDHGLDDIVVQATGSVDEPYLDGVDEVLIAAERSEVAIADRAAKAPDGGPVLSCFNGRIDNPKLSARRSSEQEEVGAQMPLLASWDFSRDLESTFISCDTGDVAWRGALVNRPGRGLIGHAWRHRDPLNYPQKQQLWSAIHFSEDDLNDAAWTTSFSWQLPDDLPSGIYAAEVSQGTQTDLLCFFVRAKQPAAPVLLLVPTNTYLAYANEHLGEGERGRAHEKSMKDPIELTPTDDYVHLHPELGLSIYDKHADGTGVMYSSWKRPVLNFRPDYRTWLNAGRRHFAADLWIVGWLESIGAEFDIATDEDLDRLGRDLLDGYRVVITGTHPEYATVRAYDALETYIHSGGRAMNLGGNGFYWVTTFDGTDASTIEVRRGLGGQRNWTSHPAELLHSSTGATGGIHLHAGRNGRELWGVTSAGVGWGPASGYVRSTDSYSADLSDLFEDIDEDVIGDFGLVLGGAAGDELESADYEKGTPRHARVLGSSSHGQQYQPFIETVMAIEPGQSGPDNPEVRADLVLIESKGSVFSVGSINWAGAMAHNQYDNNAARLCTNVLRRFLRPPAG